ncbi:MAG TPA: hypothetical protein VJB57_12965 [Dehalococcoidia bacterium]|nr:hypothetical protein [Dehalococcoidia bacterium]
MDVWLLMAAVGVAPWLLLMGLLWARRGISPRRLVWPDLSSVTSADVAREKLLAPRMAANKMFYGPVLAVGVVGGGLLLSDGEPLGVALLVGLATPSVLALVATLRAYLVVRKLEAHGVDADE